jgi:hypothetical protein
MLANILHNLKLKFSECEVFVSWFLAFSTAVVM